ncbi:MAG: cyclase family protein [Planctomycetes bacterium]|nr:cyclase family protein [Planctomycetota bacterium]
MNLLKAAGCIAALIVSFMLGWTLSGNRFTNEAGAAPPALSGKEFAPIVKGWTKGKGWGPWGKDDEVGSLNAMNADTIKAALGLVKQGKVYDLGVNYDAESFKWPGHSPTVVMTYRGPEGVRRQGDFKPAADPKLNPAKIGWHSCALFINDNVGTQIDGLGHITEGEDNRWYNGFKEADWGGNFGIRKCDATTIPPIITRGVLLDVAAFRKVDVLPPNYRITINDLESTMEEQKVKLKVGDTVMIRTGTCKYWGVNGSDHKKIGAHDSAGIDLAAARWLVEQKGAILIGSDTSGLEWAPGPNEKADGFIPVHRYLLIHQGVHIGEFHNLEELARDRVHEFCYVCMTNKIRGAVAGFTLRPIAIR